MGVSWFCGAFVAFRSAVLVARGVSPTISDTDFSLMAPDETLVTALSGAACSLGGVGLVTTGDTLVEAGGGRVGG